MTRSPRAMATRLAVLSACGLALLPLTRPQLSAQSVTGLVVDAATGDPVRQAQVQAILPGDTAAPAFIATTDRRGQFTFSLEPGTWDFVVEHAGYEPVHTTGLRIAVDEAVTLEIRLGPSPIAMEPLVVTARRTYAARTRPFYDRMKYYQGRGRFIHRQEIEQYPQSIPVDMWHPTRQGIAFRRCTTTAVFVDGVPVLSEFLTDFRLRLEDLEGVEIYRSPGTVPHELAIASLDIRPDCAVVFWTRVDFYARGREATPRRILSGAVLYGALLLGGALLLTAF